MSDARIATLQKALEKTPVTAQISPDFPFADQDLSRFRDGELTFIRGIVKYTRLLKAFTQADIDTEKAKIQIDGAQSNALTDLLAFLTASDDVLPTTNEETVASLIGRGNSLQARLKTILNKSQKILEMPLPTETELLDLYTTHALENNTKDQKDVQAETLNAKNSCLNSIKTASLRIKHIQTENQNNKVLQRLKDDLPELEGALEDLEAIANNQKLSTPSPAPIQFAAPAPGVLTSSKAGSFQPAPPVAAPDSPEQFRRPGTKVGQGA